jgi:hypothetical protein
MGGQRHVSAGVTVGGPPPPPDTSMGIGTEPERMWRIENLLHPVAYREGSRNFEVLTKLSQIPSYVENTPVKT